MNYNDGRCGEEGASEGDSQLRRWRIAVSDMRGFIYC